MKQSLFDAVGGLPTLQRVHKIFYDKVYAHPWLGKFFEGHGQEFIEQRQTAFMAEKMGGPAEYRGHPLDMAHRGMFITAELFELRAELLREALQEAGVRADLATRWLRIDGAFKRMIVKDSVASFYNKTWHYEQRLIVPRPTDG